MERGLPITYTLAPDDAEVRPVRSQVSRKLGQRYIGSIGRDVVISEAQALEGQKAIARVIPQGGRDHRPIAWHLRELVPCLD